MLDTKRVALVSGLDQQLFRNMVAAGSVVPTEHGKPGRGTGHRFSVPAAVGIVVAERLRRSDRGCHSGYAKAVRQAFAAVSEDWLLAQFHSGNTHFVTITDGVPVLGGAEYDRLSVQDAYESVTAVLCSSE